MSASRITGECSLHPLDRDYAYCQIPDSSDEDKESDVYIQRNLELRAADFYAGLRKPEAEWKSIDDLAPQLAEFKHRIRAGDYDGACRVLEPIDSDYLLLWGHYARLVELREKLLGRLTDPHSKAAKIGRLGLVYYYLGQAEPAIKLYEEALTITREIGHRVLESNTLGNLGRVYRALGQCKQAIKLYEKALTITREIGDLRNEGVLLGHLGLAYRYLGQIEWAIKLYEEALAIAREIGDRQEEVVQLGHLGTAHRVLGQVERTIKFNEDALAIAREIGDRRSEGSRLDSLGRAYHEPGRVERAIKLYEEALAVACEISDHLGESYRLLGLGKTLLTTGELSEARRRCAEALALDVPETSYQAALALGIALLYQRDPAAGDAFADAAARCRAMLDKTVSLYGARYALAVTLVGQAVCDPRWAEEGNRAELLAPALAEYRRALEICAAPGVVYDALRDLEMVCTAGIEGLEPVFELLETV